MIRRMTASLLLLFSILSYGCTPREVKPEPEEKVNYKNQYPAKLSFGVITKSSASSTDSRAFVCTWSSSDKVYVLDEKGEVAGRLELQSGEGTATGIFVMLTDLEPGARFSVQTASKDGSVPTEQTFSSQQTFPAVIPARSKVCELSGRLNDVTLDFTAAALNVDFGVNKIDFSKIVVSSDQKGAATVTLTKSAASSGADKSAWMSIPAEDLSDATFSIAVTSSDGKTYTQRANGLDFVAGKIYTLELARFGSAVIPADPSKSEFTTTKVEYKSTMDISSYSKADAKTVSGMNWIPRLTTNTLDRWGGYAGVKPDQIMSSNTEGFWRTGKYKGRWVMVNPDGNVTILHGVNGVAPDAEKGVSTDLTKSLYNQNFANTTEWVRYANKILVDYGFNFYSCNPNRIRRTREFISEEDERTMQSYTGDAELGEVSIVYLLRTFSWDYYQLTKVSPNADEASVFTLMFDPGYLDYIDELAADAAAIHKNSKNFIGYYTDNELQFRFAHASTPAIYLKMWLQLDTSAGKPRAYAYAKKYAEDFMTQNYGVEAKVENVTSEMENAFLLAVCDYYYKTATEALRKHDPNHLILGSRLHGKPLSLQQVHEACAKYCDVVSTNIYGVWEPSDSYFNTNFKSWIKADKPCFVTEFYTRNANNYFENEAYSNSGEGGGWIVKSHLDRGLYYQNFTHKLIKYNHCIGWQWFQFTDDYLTGYGWNNKGLISPKYVPYTDLLDKMLETHLNLYQIMDYYFDRESMMTEVPENLVKANWKY